MSKITERAIELWYDLYTLQMIADELGVSRTGVKKFLNRHGVDTGVTRQVVECSECGVEFEKARCQVRKNRFNYCSLGCYAKSMENPDYYENRHNQRLAREAVRGCGYYLGVDEVVHHKDGNSNDPNNLLVFRNQSDHMRWHRGDRSLVTPLWGENNS